MIPVGILGATGVVGQKLIELLALHPWFTLVALCASDKSVGQMLAGYPIRPCIPDLPCKLVFSALDASSAGPIEEQFAKAGYLVVTNASSHRMDPDVPLLIPEVNSSHLEMIRGKRGAIIANPNCSTIGLVLALKPLFDRFGLKRVNVVTLQALSGAGKGARELDIEDSVIPFIRGEEEKIECEPRKILGGSFKISAQCNRVNVSDGHLECVSVELERKATKEELKEAWESFRGLDLPFAPKKPILYLEQDDFPQPKLHRMYEGGMGICVGRLRPCMLFDYKFVVLSHNTVRGAAGGALLCAEMIVHQQMPLASSNVY